MIRKGLTCAGLVLSVACSPVEPGDAEALQHYAHRWESRGLSSYQLVLERGSCECLPEWLIPIQVTVRDGEIDSVVNVNSGEPITSELFHAMTVDELFGLVDAALTENAYQVSVQYDPDFGYPRSIYINYDREHVDDEISISARELRPIE